MPRSHDKEFFYKFMTAETAVRVLESNSLRWSAPDLFNDPFDHQVSFTFSFGEEEVISALRAAAERIVFGSDVPVIEESTTLGRMLVALRDCVNENNP